MPRVTIDATEAQSFEPTEPGPYPMTVSTIEVKKSKDAGKSMMNVEFAFEDPDTAKRCGKVFRNYMLEGKGSGFTVEFLKNFGIVIPVGEVIDFDTDEVIGRHVVAQIGNREYEGRLQNEIERIVHVA